jgi:serine/threonine protein kinase
MRAAFAIDRLLGEGGSGRVYAARWRGRPVALKVLREDRVPTDRERAHFLSEARLLRSVDHPAVVKLIGFGLLPDGRPFLAMERLEGHTLAFRIACGPMPMAEAQGVFAQVADAVGALHERGLVHRDIKPDNVFLAGARAVLLDFGIATTEEAPASTITREGTVRGTPAFMAPERFFGAPACAATDAYELAVLFYAMVTGRLPWDHVADLAGRLGPPPPSHHGVALPGAAESTLMRALSTRAEIRPSLPALAAAITPHAPPRLDRPLQDGDGWCARSHPGH